MKKLIFGIIVFAASNSLVLANDINVKNEIDQDRLFKGNCYVQVVVNVQNPCGEYLYSSPSPKYATNCGQGQAEGTTTTFYETKMQDSWNPG